MCDINKQGIYSYGDLIAIYAAIVSTGALIWQIISWKQTRSCKLKVVSKIAHRIPIFPGQKVTVDDWEKCVEVKVTNIGGRTLFITQPVIKVNKQEKKSRMIVPVEMKNPPNFPIELQHGKYHSFTYPTLPLHEFILKNHDMVKVSRFRFVIHDTLGNDYYSEWENISELKPI